MLGARQHDRVVGGGCRLDRRKDLRVCLIGRGRDLDGRHDGGLLNIPHIGGRRRGRLGQGLRLRGSASRNLRRTRGLLSVTRGCGSRGLCHGLVGAGVLAVLVEAEDRNLTGHRAQHGCFSAGGGHRWEEIHDRDARRNHRRSRADFILEAHLLGNRVPAGVDVRFVGSLCLRGLLRLIGGLVGFLHRHLRLHRSFRLRRRFRFLRGRGRGRSFRLCGRFRLLRGRGRG